MSLSSLLDGGARFDAKYLGGLSNHLPMALLALERLGADEPWPAGDAWLRRFGDRAAWPVYRSLFNEWMVFESPPRVLAQVLPALMPGCGAAAFHGLIRSACAMEAGHERELADGLAHWSCRFLPLGPLTAEQDRKPILRCRCEACARCRRACTSPALPGAGTGRPSRPRRA